MENPKSAEGKCFVCKLPIHIMNFECGHVVSYADGGKTTAENLRPICSPCNKSMGKKNLNDYMTEYHTKNKVSVPAVAPTKSKITKKESDGFFNLVGSFLGMAISTSSSSSPHGVTATRVVGAKQCGYTLTKGENKGKKCSCNAVKGTPYCTRHNKLAAGKK